MPGLRLRLTLALVVVPLVAAGTKGHLCGQPTETDVINATDFTLVRSTEADQPFEMGRIPLLVWLVNKPECSVTVPALAMCTIAPDGRVSSTQRRELARRAHVVFVTYTAAATAAAEDVAMVRRPPKWRPWPRWRRRHQSSHPHLVALQNETERPTTPPPSLALHYHAGTAVGAARVVLPQQRLPRPPDLPGGRGRR
jgi:hypothetical protein